VAHVSLGIGCYSDHPFTSVKALEDTQTDHNQQQGIILSSSTLECTTKRHCYLNIGSLMASITGTNSRDKNWNETQM